MKNLYKIETFKMRMMKWLYDLRSLGAMWNGRNLIVDFIIY